MCEIALSHQCPIEGLTRLKTEVDFSGNLSMKLGSGVPPRAAKAATGAQEMHPPRLGVTHGSHAGGFLALK